MDSRHSHLNWAADLGGISYPLLADFHPKGAVGRAYGLYLEKEGFDDRATVIIDREGVVRHASTVGPGGQRDINELFQRAKEVAAGSPHGAAAVSPERKRLSEDATLYVKDGCRFCQAVLRAVQNLHCDKAVTIRNVTKDPEARKELDRIAGAGAKVPALVQEGKPLFESAAIISVLAQCYGR